MPDVAADARYLACSLETRSEIVVPVIKGGAFWGEVDIDSDRPDAFGPDDVEEFLDKVSLPAWSDLIMGMVKANKGTLAPFSKLLGRLTVSSQEKEKETPKPQES